MDPTHQHQQTEWPQQQHIFASDSEHWDATVEQLLAFLDDPELIACHDDRESELGDGSDNVAADVSASEPLSEKDAAVVDEPSGADLTTSESPSEEDVEFIESSTGGRIAELFAATPENGAAHGFPPASSAVSTKSAPGSTGRMSRSNGTAGANTNKYGALAIITATTSIAALESAERARRERNRLKVRRFYYRKMDRLNALRAQVTDLEENLERLTIAQNTSADLSIVATTTTSTQPTFNVGYAELLQQLSSTKQRLQHENEYLRRIVSQHVRSVHAISVELMQQREPSVAYLKIKSMTRQECAELCRRTLKKVRKFVHSHSLFKDNGRVCGWQSTHFIQNKTFKFSLERTQPNHSAAQIGQLLWSVLSDPEQYVRLFSSAVDMKCYVVQTLDADNFVIFHEFRTMNPLEEHLAIIRSTLLVSRVRSESGFLATMTSLDREKWVLEDGSSSLEEAQDTVIWSDLSCWMQYQDMPDSSGCACLFAGYMPIVGSNIGFWMLEMVQLAVRCETMTLGAASYSLLTTTDESGNEGLC